MQRRKAFRRCMTLDLSEPLWTCFAAGSKLVRILPAFFNNLQLDLSFHYFHLVPLSLLDTP